MASISVSPITALPITVLPITVLPITVLRALHCVVPHRVVHRRGIGSEIVAQRSRLFCDRLRIGRGVGSRRRLLGVAATWLAATLAVGATEADPRCPSAAELAACDTIVCAPRAALAVVGDGGTPSATELFLDRVVYAAEDRYAHVFVQSPRDRVEIEVRREEGRERVFVGRAAIRLEDGGAVAFLLPLEELSPGNYLLAGGEAATAQIRFTRSGERHRPAVEMPAEIPLVIASGDGAGSAADLGRWPMQTAVAFPAGAVASPRELTLLEDGEPIAAQWAVRSWWAVDCSSVRWASLDFTARRSADGWRDYRVVRQRELARPAATAGTVARDVAGVGGPYVVDRDGRVYRPEATSTWRWEEEGAVRSSAIWAGTLRDPAGAPHARFEARLARFAGTSAVRLRLRFILTAEALAAGVRDAAWEVPLVGAAERIVAAVDGRTVAASGPGPTATAFLHQERGDRCRWVTGERTESGERCDGWLSATTSRETTVVALRRMAETFPRELEVRGDRLIAHLWPAHGRRVYSPAEERSRREIYKLRYAHQGETLELALPAAYADELRRLDTSHGPDRGWDAERALERALRIPAAGVALSAELWLARGAPGRVDAAALAAAVERAPHALQMATTLAASGAEGAWLAASPERFPVVEHALGELYPRHVAAAGADPANFGMWVHGGVHNSWDPRRDVASLHRVWQASHDRNVSGAWLLYARSGDPRLLDWARDTSRQFRDVHVLGVPVGNDPAGAMDHCKGFLPWAARSALWQHWIDADALRWRALLLGDRAAAALYATWGRSLAGMRQQLRADRGTVTSLGELIEYYRWSHDPRALASIRDWGEVSLATPFEKYPSAASFPVWHREWLARYFDLTRDRRAVERAVAWLRAGYSDPAVVALASREGEATPAWIAAAAARLYAQARTTYDAPGERFDGYGSWRANARSRWLYSAPYLLRALAASGTPDAVSGFEPVYPAAGVPAGERGRERPPGLEVWILDRRDRPFTLRLRTPTGFGDLGVASLRLVAPSGRLVAASEQRFLSEPERVIDVPRDGERGLYRLECRGHRCPFIAPLSDLPEAARLAPGRRYNALDRTRFLLLAESGSRAAMPLELRFSASQGVTPAYPETALPAWVRVVGDDGNTRLDTSLFHFGERSEATVALPPESAASAVVIETASRYGPVLELSPHGALLAVRETDLERIARALAARAR